MGLDLSEIEDQLNGASDEDDDDFLLWPENLPAWRAFVMLGGSYRHVAGGASVATLTPELAQMYKSIEIVGVKKSEREAMVLDLTAMCAEYCSVLNKRKGK